MRWADPDCSAPNRAAFFRLSKPMGGPDCRVGGGGREGQSAGEGSGVLEGVGVLVGCGVGVRVGACVGAAAGGTGVKVGAGACVGRIGVSIGTGASVGVGVAGMKAGIGGAVVAVGRMVAVGGDVAVQAATQTSRDNETVAVSSKSRRFGFTTDLQSGSNGGLPHSTMADFAMKSAVFPDDPVHVRAGLPCAVDQRCPASTRFARSPRFAR